MTEGVKECTELISRLQRPGYDLQKEQAIQEAIVVLQQLNAERGAMRAEIEAMKQQSVPEGYTLVPIELTHEMVEACYENWQFGDKSARDIWRDMLAASPCWRRDE